MGYLGKEVEASFKVDYDVTGRAQCRQCKKMNKTELRMGKLVGNFFDKSRKGMIYHYFHPNCLIQNLKRCRIMSGNIETAIFYLGEEPVLYVILVRVDLIIIIIMFI